MPAGEFRHLLHSLKIYLMPNYYTILVLKLKMAAHNIKWFVILTICAYALSACCTKKGCPASGAISQMELVNFPISQADSIDIEAFKSNSDFTIKVDSFLTGLPMPSGSDSTISVSWPSKFGISMDYEVIFIATGRVFKINNFQLQKTACNTCFPVRPASEYFNTIVSYMVDSVAQPGPGLVIKY